MMLRIRYFYCLLYCSLLCASGFARADLTIPPPAQVAIDQVLQLTAERLALAVPVAQSKWNSGAPIDDPAREAIILQHVVAQAQQYGLSSDLARAYFQAQFSASKMVQQHLHAHWRAAGHAPFDPTPDLARDVRPALDRLTPVLLRALSTLQGVLVEPGSGAWIRARAAKKLTLTPP